LKKQCPYSNKDVSFGNKIPIWCSDWEIKRLQQRLKEFEMVAAEQGADAVIGFTVGYVGELAVGLFYGTAIKYVD
jgi:hypothetical protein